MIKARETFLRTAFMNMLLDIVYRSRNPKIILEGLKILSRDTFKMDGEGGSKNSESGSNPPTPLSKAEKARMQLEVVSASNFASGIAKVQEGLGFSTGNYKARMIEETMVCVAEGVFDLGQVCNSVHLYPMT